ncbi:N-6 DNA methylase [bacterium]|nr:N-6 DNA methylase [bacterium]
MIERYIKDINTKYDKGDTTEPSFYETLKSLIENYSKKFLNFNIDVRILPRKTEGGNPDIKVSKENNEIIGYIEVKDLKIENLDKIEESEQLKRYRETFPNLILTNLFEFRLYRDGKLIDKVELGRPFDVFELKTIYVSEKIRENFYKLFEKFFSFSIPQALTPENLAKVLAKKTKFLKEIAFEELKNGEQFLTNLYENIKKHLITDLNEDDFCDLYSQTITYGLFTGRLRSKNRFDRKEAYDVIPKNFGILRDIFKIISLEDISENMIWIIDDITNLLSKVDINQIFENYLKEKKGEDPVIYFYETFLSEYDPKEREKKGVYYTPDSVVSFIIRSINTILKEKFNLPDGLGDKRVTLLDPAGGTLTFLEESIKLVIKEFKEKYGSGGLKNFVKEHILENFYAFELMMAPYVIGHLRIIYLLKDYGYELSNDERVKYYLTNTLEMEEIKSEFPFMPSISEESKKAGEVKKNVPILVIMGNPPYSGISANKGEWITEKIEDYKYIDEEYFGEKKHWLQDDYVKFIRFAQDKIESNGEGIVGFITNHSYLDNPTFRGMRYSLLKTFDEIYILNLHGNSLKKEVCPDGSKDENVFDIRQGVAISIFVKKKDYQGEKKIYYSDLWGLREEKYKFLEENDIKTIEFTEIKPKKDFFFFVPREEKEVELYNKFIKVTDIFKIYSTGIVTARDDFVIDFDLNKLKARINIFRDKTFSDEFIKENFKLKNTRGWKLEKIRLEFSKLDDVEKYFTKILYRPFDIRWILYSEFVIDWTRKEVMQHMIKENLGLLLCRQQSKTGFYHSLISNYITESSVVSNKTREITYHFPLYLYPSLNKNHIFEKEYKVIERIPNIKEEIFEMLQKEYKKEVTPEEILYYIYGVLYSNNYREKYAEFLKIDFPRVPFTKDYEIFKKIGSLGEELISLHLLKSEKLNNPVSKFEGEGNNIVKYVKYDENKKSVFINENQYFTNIENDVWGYMIGGYQVLYKWLKDRKGRCLSLDEILTYTKIVTSLKYTIELQKEIDTIELNNEI